ncbi:hypothetical protein K7432_014155 [Basidiobolus ranarum]|uniref:Cation-transporting P-type ATPase N-terminal domain-containing protein n=1 Tax=Basidiobolus ranarum TaxID=34480 RepID=A0ABR2VQ15_9FUNG
MSANDEKKAQLEEHAHQEMAEEISPELEALLHTDPSKGLTSAEITQRLQQFGPNQLSEKKKNPFLKFLSYFTGAIAYLIEIAWILSAVVQDWINFGIIGGLLILLP